MRHRSLAKVFGRRPEARKALFRGLATSLITYDRIETTLAKAKELRRVVDPLVTLAKRGDLHARRQAASFVYTKDAVSKLFSDVAARFKDRNGGYTRIYKVGRRRGDGAEMALIEFVVRGKTESKKEDKKEKKPAAPKKEAKASTAEPKAKASKTEAKKPAKKKTESK